jgi:hypothetical protein
MKSAKPPRDVVVKALFNPDEFLEFRDACAAADVKHSHVLRDLAKGFVERFKNGKAAAKKPEWPSTGQKMAMAVNRGVFGAPRAYPRL